MDPWSLINIPGEVFEAIIDVLKEQAEEQEREKRRNDLRARLRGAVGR